jgi:hypothetical protein
VGASVGFTNKNKRAKERKEESKRESEGKVREKVYFMLSGWVCIYKNTTKSYKWSSNIIL